MNFLFFFLQPVQTPDVLIDPVVSLSDFFRNIDRLEFLTGLLIAMDDDKDPADPDLVSGNDIVLESRILDELIMDLRRILNLIDVIAPLALP